MMLKIILNCTAYESPYNIDMRPQIPDFNKIEIGNNVLYEDAAYTGTILLSEYDTTDVKEIHIYRNNTKIGTAQINNACNGQYDDNNKYASNGAISSLKLSLPIKFESSFNYAQPFLHQYDIILLSVVILRNNLDKEEYYSPYQLCVSKNISDTENVEKMVSHLISIPDKRVSDLMYGSVKRMDLSDTIKRGRYSPMSKKSVFSYINMIEDTLNSYRKHLAYFAMNAKHVVKKVSEISEYNRIRSVSASSVQWLSKNMDVLTPVNRREGLNIYGSNYLPLRLYTDTTKIDFNVYENRVIVGFLKTMVTGIRKLLISFKQGITDEENLLKKMSKLVGQQYTAPIITVKRIHLHHMQGMQDKVMKLQKEAVKLYQAYMDTIPCSQMEVIRVPRVTKTFQEIVPYRIIYKHIIEWFMYGEMDVEKNSTLFHVKTIDKLFEYFCLSRIISSILDKGFVPSKEKPSYPFFYSGKDAYAGFQNETDVANTYEFYKSGIILRLYFQPVIFSYTFENKITLFRTTGNRKIYTPDFCIQMSIGDRNPRYAILDAKYASSNNVRDYYIKDLIQKYDANIADQYCTDAIKVLWILRGRVEENTATDIYHNSPLARRFSDNIRISVGTTPVNTANYSDVYNLISEICTYLYSHS